MNISILGGGSWGAALAIHLIKKRHAVKVWEFFPEMAQEMQEHRRSKLLPADITLPPAIWVSSDLKAALAEAELIIIAVPSDKVEPMLLNAKNYIQHQPVVICSKGFASGLRLLSEIVKEHCRGEVYCLYGPTHAEEVCKGMFSGIILAGGSEIHQLRREIETQDLVVDLSNDIIGVQVCAGLKNIVALAAGIVDGLGSGDNARAFIITKGLEEISAIGQRWGAKPETFVGLAGIGDLLVTCLSTHSRNRFVGREVGKGRSLQDVLAGMTMVAEGVTTLHFVPELKQRFNIELPLFSRVHNILFDGKKPETLFQL